MAEIDADRVVQILGQKVSEGILREAMHQAYTEQLEKQIESLQQTIRERELNGVARVSGQETVRTSDRETHI